MRFTKTRIRGAWLIDPEPKHDQRGLFVRTFCARACAERGLVTEFVQHSRSYSSVKGTLRGMHFQRAPHAEVKVVSCLRGALWDVIIDLRPGSPSYGRWEGFELTAANRRLLYVPEGCAHGFQTLCDDVEVSYLISAYYEPAAAAGLRYDDAAFRVDWPLPIAVISERDRSWPAFEAGVSRDRSRSGVLGRETPVEAAQRAPRPANTAPSVRDRM